MSSDIGWINLDVDVGGQNNTISKTFSEDGDANSQ